ncbi:ABC transporter ATP-binding protein [Microbacterium panaciterrae]
MTDGQVLEFSHVTKRFGALTAVDELSARIEPGAVTAFLGPNGAGKTTSLRMLLGQIRPTSGTATIGGIPHAELRHPLRTIGSVLEEAVYRPRRTAPRQLTIAAKANGIPLSRVDEVLALVGLQNETETRIGAYSLGMRQRLSIAGALLGDPGALVLDEPANGLDPEGIRWMRLLMRRLADEGRTILVSSHVLSEIEQVADNVLVLAKGRVVYADSIDKLSDPTTGSVVVDADDREGLTTALKNAGLSFDVLRSGLTVHNTDAAAVGALAVTAGIALSTLQQRGPSLEEVFLDLVHGRRDAMTGAIPIVAGAGGAPAAGEAPADEASAADEAAPAVAETEGAEGAAAAGAGVAAAGAAAVAGAAGLFGTAAEATSAGAAAAVPTTRREAAEFAAAQSSDGAAADADDAADATETAPVTDADGSEGAESSSEGAESSSEGAESSSEGDQESETDDGEAQDAAAEGQPTDGTAETQEPEGGEGSEGAEGGEGSEGAEGGEGSEGEPEPNAEDTDNASDEHAENGHDDEHDQSGSETEGAPEADAEQHADQHADDGAEQSKDDPEQPAAESSAIAAGVALTAPIDAPEYSPGETASHEDGQGADEQAITHAPEGGEQNAALGSFATAALTIPDAARTVSFDELITGVPSAGEQSGDDAQAESAPDEQPSGDEHEAAHDDAATAATTVIGTTPETSADGENHEFAAPEPSTETTEIAGIEIFAALAEGRTQEIQVILDDSHDDEDLAGEEVTAGEIAQDEDPRAAAVSASLAAAARAFYSDDAPSYTPAPTTQEEQTGEQHDGDQPGEPSDREQDAHQQDTHHDGDDHHDNPHGEQHEH